MPLKDTPATATDVPSRYVRLAASGSAALLALAAAVFYIASSTTQNGKPTAGAAIIVAISARQCDPDTLTVPAGHTTFQIVNRSSRKVEWEILDGVMVVEERKNIAPGFTQILSATLAPGEYAISCGLLGNPRGRLIVTPSQRAGAIAAHPLERAYIGPLSEYRVILTREAKELRHATDALASAGAAGNLPQSRELYIAAHRSYMRLAPVADMFADLAPRMDARLCHGDLSLQFCANTMDTNIHALRDILKNLPGLLVLRWKQEGTVPVLPERHGEPAESARNFLGFRDGSANPDWRDDALMQRVVWIDAHSAEPAWAARSWRRPHKSGAARV